MDIELHKVTPFICPLCGSDNACGNQANNSQSNENSVCWCSDQTLTFPKELLLKVAKEQQGKACICKVCVLKYHQAQGVQICKP